MVDDLGAVDLLPIGDIVMVANPHAFNPTMEASEIEIIGRDNGRIVLATGYQSYGEPVRRTRSKSGATSEIWLSSIRLRPESKVGSEMQRRYGAGESAQQAKERACAALGPHHLPTCMPPSTCRTSPVTWRASVR
jgi:hypothetical protein